MPISVSAVVDCTNHVTASAEKLENSRVPTNLFRQRKIEEILDQEETFYVCRKKTDRRGNNRYKFI